MACYAAVVSLKLTLQHLKKSCNAPSIEIVQLAYEEVRLAQKLLQELDVVSGVVEHTKFGVDDVGSYEWGKKNSLVAILKRGRESTENNRGFRDGDVQRMKALDGKMREAVCELEDALETHLINHGDESMLIDLSELRQVVDSFCLRVKELKEEYTKEEEVEVDVAASSGIGNNRPPPTKMVGFSDVLSQMKCVFLEGGLGIYIGSLVGMAGLGKTTLASEFFEDPEVLNWFDHRVWITVGPKYQLIDIVKSVLDQVNPSFAGVPVMGDELPLFLRLKLKDQRCLVVLDDVWNKEIITHMDDLILKATFGRKLGSLILLTTRIEKVGTTDRRLDLKSLKLRFLTKEESWDLLREKVFGEESSSCPPQLEKCGKMIAEKCEGLPLTVITVADILSKANQMTPEYWNKAARNENSVFNDAYDQMSKVLLQSYDYLPRSLKEFFLYMGVFPQKYDIPLSKLTMLWSAERCFLLRESKSIGDSRAYLSKHLVELVGKSLVLVRKMTYKHKPKTYCLHSALWHSCVREAGRNKFFHVFNNYVNSVASESIKNQRRLCIHNNVLFAIKDVHKAMASISTARSLLCTGPHHRYPVPICFNLMLLRVIDALAIRFYEFPVEVVKLLQLRYLTLTCDGNLPSSISKLSNLQVLIVRQYMSIIKLHEDETSSLPMEIWDMKELEHLQVMGHDLPDPCDGDVLLPNLVTLLDVGSRSCTEGVLKGVPKLKNIGIRIELSIDGPSEPPLRCFDHISCLSNLESLKCVVVNPALRSEVVSLLASSSLFPCKLKRLSLSGLGCSWEDIKVIASLPRLEVLKLRCYAFRGPKWETRDKEFPSLEFLLIEDTDLVHWTMGSESFSKLQCLNLKQCYNLQEIEWKPRRSLKRIEIDDCNPSALSCARQIQKSRSKMEVHVHSSLDAVNEAT